MKEAQLYGSLNILWHCLSLGLEQKLTFSLYELCVNSSCISCLYILEIKPLSVTSFVNIFSQFIGYLFILFYGSFGWATACKFDSVPFVYFLSTDTF